MQDIVEDLSLSGVTVLTGADDAIKVVPNVICMCDGSSEEDPKFSGNWAVNAAVIVTSSAKDTTLATHRSTVSSVFQAFSTTTIAADMAGKVSDFHVFGVVLGDMDSERNSVQFTDTLNMEIHCCANDLT